MTTTEARPLTRGSAHRLLPREHGTWAMLLVPWAIGAFLGHHTDARAILLLGALVLLFVAQNQTIIGYRALTARRADPRASATTTRLAIATGAAGIALAAPLVFVWGRTWLIAFGVAGAGLVAGALALVDRRLDHLLPGQLLAAGGLALGAPAASYVTRGALEPIAVAAGLLSAAFSVWAVFYVRLKIEARARRAAFVALRAKLAFARETLVVDVALAAVAIAALRLGALSSLAALALLPPALQTLVGVATLDRPAGLKRVGVELSVHAVVYTALVIGLA